MKRLLKYLCKCYKSTQEVNLSERIKTIKEIAVEYDEHFVIKVTKGGREITSIITSPKGLSNNNQL